MSDTRVNHSSLRRWLGWLIVASIFAVACAFLANWQFARREEALTRISLIRSNYDQTPSALSELLPYNSFNPDQEWRPVLVKGHYLPETSVLVRNRPLNGQPGFLQLIGFKLDDGKIIAIERGWLPTGNLQDSPDFVPSVSSDQIELIGRLRQSEPNIGRDAPAGQLATLNLNDWVADRQIQEPVYKGFYLRMQGETPSAGKAAKAMPMPEMSEGNHLSYALQWILFALMALGALLWAVRSEVAARRLATGKTTAKPKRSRLGDSDKEFEDSL